MSRKFLPHPTTRLPRTKRTSQLPAPIPHPTTRFPRTHRTSDLTGQIPIPPPDYQRHIASLLTAPMPHPTVKGTQRQSTDSPNSPTHCEGNTAPVYWQTQFLNPLWREHSAILLTAPIPHPTVKGTQRQSTDSPNSPTHCEGNTAPIYWQPRFPNPLWSEHSASLITAPIPQPTVKEKQHQSTHGPEVPAPGVLGLLEGDLDLLQTQFLPVVRAGRAP